MSESSRSNPLWPLLAAFAAFWVPYAIAVRLLPGDSMAAWRNQHFWPSSHYLATGEPGFGLPLAAHAVLGIAGGLLIALLLTLMARGVCRLFKIADRARWQSLAWVVLPVVFVWSFLLVKGVPEHVTVIDADAHRLHMRPFGFWDRMPRPAREVNAADVSQLVATTAPAWPSDAMRLELWVVTRAPERLFVGARACDSQDEQACLASGDRDLVELARLLALPESAPVASEDGHERALQFVD